jgi:Tfp pilus assembly protein PilO
MKWLETEKGKGGAEGGDATSIAKSFFEVAVVFLCIILFGVYLFFPQKAHYDNAKKEYNALETQYSVLEKQKKQLGELSVQLKNHASDIEKMNRLIPDSMEPASLYYLLEQMAAGSGLTAINVSVDLDPEAVSAGGDNASTESLSLKHMDARVRGSGSIEQVQSFLKLVESAPRMLNTQELEINATQSGYLVFTVTVRAYVYAPAANKISQ